LAQISDRGEDETPVGQSNPPTTSAAKTGRSVRTRATVASLIANQVAAKQSASSDQVTVPVAPPNAPAVAEPVAAPLTTVMATPDSSLTDQKATGATDDESPRPVTLPAAAARTLSVDETAISENPERQKSADALPFAATVSVQPAKPVDVPTALPSVPITS